MAFVNDYLSNEEIEMFKKKYFIPICDRDIGHYWLHIGGIYTGNLKAQLYY